MTSINTFSSKIINTFNIFHCSNGVKSLFRIFAYSVISTQISVIYFGGYNDDEGSNDIIAEYKGLKWTRLGSLASSRHAHRSIRMGSYVFVIGGLNKTLADTEIWENTGSLINPNYARVFTGDYVYMSSSNATLDFGEIIRVDIDFQCDNREPAPPAVIFADYFMSIDYL